MSTTCLKQHHITECFMPFHYVPEDMDSSQQASQIHHIFSHCQAVCPPADFFQNTVKKKKTERKKTFTD